MKAAENFTRFIQTVRGTKAANVWLDECIQVVETDTHFVYVRQYDEPNGDESLFDVGVWVKASKQQTRVCIGVYESPMVMRKFVELCAELVN